MGNYKKIPKNDWLLNLHNYRKKENPIGQEMCEGPWYSNDGEDGVLSYLFDYINDKYKFAVDIGSAHGYGGSNVRHLVDKYEWESLETDYDDGSVENNKWKRIHPRVKKETIFEKNVCEIFEKYKVPKRFDLLSLDIDSLDWYVLRGLLIGGYEPSVAIIEYNPIFTCQDAYVRDYDEGYHKDGTSVYGASAKAYEMLMVEAGYTLIHMFGNPDEKIYSNNMIFLHNDFINKKMKIKSIEELHPKAWVEPWKNQGDHFWIMQGNGSTPKLINNDNLEDLVSFFINFSGQMESYDLDSKRTKKNTNYRFIKLEENYD